MKTYPAANPFCWAAADCMAHPVAALLSPSEDLEATFTTLVCEKHARVYLARLMQGEAAQLRNLKPDEIERIRIYEEKQA